MRHATKRKISFQELGIYLLKLIPDRIPVPFRQMVTGMRIGFLFLVH